MLTKNKDSLPVYNTVIPGFCRKQKLFFTFFQSTCKEVRAAKNKQNKKKTLHLPPRWVGEEDL
jgi:hypothetical protein